MFWRESTHARAPCDAVETVHLDPDDGVDEAELAIVGDVFERFADVLRIGEFVDDDAARASAAVDFAFDGDADEIAGLPVFLTGW